MCIVRVLSESYRVTKMERMVNEQKRVFKQMRAHPSAR